MLPFFPFLPEKYTQFLQFSNKTVWWLDHLVWASSAVYSVVSLIYLEYGHNDSCCAFWQYYLDKNLEARKRELDREAELEEKAPKVKAKSKMSKVKAKSNTKFPVRNKSFFEPPLVSLIPYYMHFMQEEKQARKKQKMLAFQQANAKSKGLKNAKRWNWPTKEWNMHQLTEWSVMQTTASKL